MKLTKILSEQTFAKYEQFEDVLMKAKENENYREYEAILKSALQKKQYDWFCRHLSQINRVGGSNSIFKEMFKHATPF